MPNDIHATLAISREEARQGTNRTLTLPGGRQVSITIPPGTSNGQTIRLDAQTGSLAQAGSADLLVLTIAVTAPQIPVADPSADDATIHSDVGPGRMNAASSPSYQSNIGSSVDNQAATKPTTWNTTGSPTNIPSSQNRTIANNPPTPLPVGQFGTPLSNQAQGKLTLKSEQPFVADVRNAGMFPPSAPYQTLPGAPPARNARSPLGTIVLLLTLVVLLVGGSVGAFYYFSNNHGTGTAGGPDATATALAQGLTATSSAQGNNAATSTAIAQGNANSTATAQANQASTNATATAQVYATATAQVYATATAVALQNPYGGTLAFSDPMSDNSGGHNWAETSGCLFSGGAYHVVANANFGNVCRGQNTNYSNFAMQAKLSFASSGQHFSGLGFVFRSDGNYNEYELTIFERGTYYIAVCRYTSPGADCSRALVQGTIPNWKVGLNNPNTVAIVANGSDISLYVNAQRIAHVNDTTYTQGQIGFVSAGGDGTADVAVSKVKVWTF